MVSRDLPAGLADGLARARIEVIRLPTDTLVEAEPEAIIRPAAGMHTREHEAVLGRRAASTIRRGTPLSADLLGPENGA